jgi:uncharacterized protein (TIGR02145 family)
MNSLYKFVTVKLTIICLIFVSIVFFNACKKEETNNTKQAADSITDIDGNVYKTVKIGSQWWMAEDLRVVRFRNGDSIIKVGNISQYSSQFDTLRWTNIDSGAYCTNNGIKYNWYAIGDTRNIAPIGWHVPTDDEWKQLEMHLGMSNTDANKVNWRGTNEGNKLKLQSGWYNSSNAYQVWGTNESGFTALGKGCVMFNGQNGAPGATYTGFWWTSTKQGNEAWYRYLDYQKPNVFRYYGPLTYGFSIRCVKD